MRLASLVTGFGGSPCSSWTSRRRNPQGRSWAAVLLFEDWTRSRDGGHPCCAHLGARPGARMQRGGSRWEGGGGRHAGTGEGGVRAAHAGTREGGGRAAHAWLSSFCVLVVGEGLFWVGDDFTVHDPKHGMGIVYGWLLLETV